MKKKASPMILDIYRSNKSRLAQELAKDVKDRSTHNSIAALKYICQTMEQVYDLGF